MPLSIGKKILLSLMAVSMIPLIVTGFIVARVAERSLKDEVIGGLTSLSESTRGHLVDYVADNENIASLFSHTPVVINSMENFNKDFARAGGPESYAAIERRYRHSLEFLSNNGFNGLYLITTSGDIVFSLSKKEDVGRSILIGPYKGTEFASVFKRVRETKKTAISEFKVFPLTKQPAAFIVAPVMKDKKVLGFLALKLATKGLYKHVKDYTGLGKTGEIVLAELDGENIVFAAPLRHDPKAAFKRKVRIGSKEALPMQHAIQRQKGSGISIDYRGKKTIAVWSYFAPLRLGLVIKQDTPEAFASVADIRKWALVVGMITLILVMTLSALVAKSIARPIKKLHEGVEKVGAGDLSYNVGTSSRDEIGQLSRAFDDMTTNLGRITASRDDLDKEIAERKRAEGGLRESEGRLRDYSKNLEKTVEQRTDELKSIQAQLLVKERLAAIGRLSSSVGHELRNPLGVIGNSVYYLNMKLKDRDGNISKHLGILEREVRRSNRIISDLLDFSRARSPELRSGDINGLIRETLEDIKIPENITVDMDGMEDLPAFLFDADQIHQLIVNLITNALQAMADGGRLCIRTGARGGFAVISFEDTGVGIPAEDLKKIFEPLYTTRAVGTGLGLSIVKGIVERHNGTITVESKAGEGTVFTVRLPLERKKV